MEACIRRRDLLVDEQSQVEFYLTHLPLDVHSVAAFNQWWQAQQREHAVSVTRPLNMQLSDLLRREANEYSETQFPDAIEVAGNRLTLNYKFEPAQEDDGVTITVPEPLLATMNLSTLQWCVPGWHLERLTEILRALPKSLRKSFVPVPSHAEQALQDIQSARDINLALATWISRHGGTEFSVDDLQSLVLPSHLQPWVRVVDMDDRQVTAGRNLSGIHRIGQQRLHQRPIEKAATVSHELMRSWECDALPLQRGVERNGLRYTVYPTLEDRGDGVIQADAATPALAEASLAQAVLKLAMLALPQQYKFVRQQIAAQRELMLLGQSVSTGKPLVDALAERVFRECFLIVDEPLPRTRDAFQALIERGRQRLNDSAAQTLKVITEVFTEWRQIKRSLDAHRTPVFAGAIADIEAQLQMLLPDNFLIDTPAQWFMHLPRYLRAIVKRIERLQGNAARDKALQLQVQPAQQAWQKMQATLRYRHPALERLRWMIEEFRVSLFAQELRASIPVSAKRIEAQIEQVQKEIAAQPKAPR
jgi:ATP-dependent helicase HrpA